MASHPPSLGSFKVKIMKGNRAVTEAILSLSVVIIIVLSGQPPPFQKSWICRWFVTSFYMVPQACGFNTYHENKGY